MALNKTGSMLPSMRLEKAKLLVYSDPTGDAKDIEFMFNPSELDFTRVVHWASDVGNRGSTLLPKVNFSGVEPYSFTLQNLLFDTYEKKISVLTEYIDNIKKGATARSSIKTRPPVYILTWHDTYFHCVMTNLNYKLTLFLADGTPVKAIVNISLQEVDPANRPGSQTTNSTGQQDPRLDNSGGGRGNSGRGRGNSGRGRDNSGGGSGNFGGGSGNFGGGAGNTGGSGNFGGGSGGGSGGSGNFGGGSGGSGNTGGGAGNTGAGNTGAGGGSGNTGGGAGNTGAGSGNTGGGAGNIGAGSGNTGGGAGNTGAGNTGRGAGNTGGGSGNTGGGAGNTGAGNTGGSGNTGGGRR